MIICGEWRAGGSAQGYLCPLCCTHDCGMNHHTGPRAPLCLLVLTLEDIWGAPPYTATHKYTQKHTHTHTHTHTHNILAFGMVLFSADTHTRLRNVPIPSVGMQASDICRDSSTDDKHTNTHTHTKTLCQRVQASRQPK